VRGKRSILAERKEEKETQTLSPFNPPRGGGGGSRKKGKGKGGKGRSLSILSRRRKNIKNQPREGGGGQAQPSSIPYSIGGRRKGNRERGKGRRPKTTSSPAIPISPEKKKEKEGSVFIKGRRKKREADAYLFSANSLPKKGGKKTPVQRKKGGRVPASRVNAGKERNEKEAAKGKKSFGTNSFNHLLPKRGGKRRGRGEKKREGKGPLLAQLIYLETSAKGKKREKKYKDQKGERKKGKRKGSTRTVLLRREGRERKKEKKEGEKARFPHLVL